jgi:hypothetical protein
VTALRAKAAASAGETTSRPSTPSAMQERMPLAPMQANHSVGPTSTLAASVEAAAKGLAAAAAAAAPRDLARFAVTARR